MRLTLSIVVPCNPYGSHWIPRYRTVVCVAAAAKGKAAVASGVAAGAWGKLAAV